MQIREIQIDGFGIFANRRIAGLTSGLNVLYGENEAGKTTLIEFIRRILFGFPRRVQGTNLYPPLSGGAHGGRLVCEMAGGEPVVLSRTHSGKEKIGVSTGSEEHEGAEALAKVLGHASKELFINIHAFTLDELADFNSLKGEEIKNRIYGAGLGLGPVSLKAVDKALGDRCDAIFKPRGKKPMNQLLVEMEALERDIAQVQESLSEYDALNERLTRMEGERRTLDTAWEALERRKKTLEAKRDLFPAAAELATAKTALAALADLPGFPENGLPQLDAILFRKKELANRLQEEERTLAGWMTETGGLSVPVGLLERRQDVLFLQQSMGSLPGAEVKQSTMAQEIERLDTEIEADRRELQGEWHEETILEFQFGAQQLRECRSFHEAMQTQQEQLGRAVDKLDYYRQQKAAERAKGWNILLWLKGIALVQGVLGICGLGWGVFSGNRPLMLVSLCLLALGGVLFRKFRREMEEFFQEDLLETSLAQKAEAAQTAMQSLAERWRSFLETAGLPETLDPVAAQHAGKTLMGMREKYRHRVSLAEELRQMQETGRAVRERVEAVEPLLEEPPRTGSLGERIERIHRSFETAKRNQERAAHLDKQIAEQKQKIEKLQEMLAQSEAQRQEFLHSAGAEDEADYRQKHQRMERRRALLETIQRNEEHVRTRIGEGADPAAFIAELEAADADAVRRELEAATAESKALGETRDGLLHALGETTHRRDRLAGSDDLSIKQTALEMRRQQMKDLGREWAAAKLAREFLEAARKQYETHRQPAVLKAAEDLFAQITGGSYRKIVKPADGDALLVETERGERKQLFELSRGTREQLYLSMRLGLIEEYERRAEPLPVILDDVLVNFDETRRQRVMQRLVNFARDRQVLALTCHAAVKDAYAALGAQVVSFAE